MNNVRLSIDKVSVEYHEVTVNFYNKLALSFRDWFDVKPAKRHKGYVYHWNLAIGGSYLYLRYQQWQQKKSNKYTLQIETHPDHLIKFQRLLVALYSHTKKVYFSRCELVFDFPYSMNNIFIASKTGRKMSIYEGSRYFGKKYQSKDHAFCRTYDKKQSK